MFQIFIEEKGLALNNTVLVYYQFISISNILRLYFYNSENTLKILTLFLVKNISSSGTSMML